MLTRVLMFAAAAFLVISLRMTHDSGRFSPRDLPHGFPTHGLALQFATEMEDVARIVGGSGSEHPDQRLMRSQIAQDWALIASYVVVFVTAGLWTLGQRHLGRWRLVGWMTIAAGGLAAAFDFWENAAILAALESPVVPSAANAAYLKWTFFFLPRYRYHRRHGAARGSARWRRSCSLSPA
jgi:hypothetical protein